MEEGDWKLRIEKKLDLLTTENSKQNITLGKMEVLFEKNTEILQEHQRRSLASERRLDVVEKTVEHTDKKIASHLAFLRGAIWFVGIISTVAGISLTINKLFF